MKKRMSSWLVSSVLAGICGIGALGGMGCGSEDAPADGQLTRTDPASKEECPAGGGVLLRGDDDDGDGVLDQGEVDERTVQCNPLRELTRIVEVPPGTRCFAGGVARQRGLDRNGNDFLDADEIEETLHECSTVVTFNVTIRSAAEALVLAPITEIRGDLTVESTGEDGVRELSLPQLRKVTGRVWIGNDAQLTAVAMPALAEIGGAFAVGGTANNQLRALSFPELRSIGGSFTVVQNPLLPGWEGFPQVAFVGGDFVVLNNPQLTAARAPTRRVAGSLFVSNNPRLTALQIEMSEGARIVSVQGNAMLPSLAVEVSASGPSSAGAVLVHDNSRLASVVVRAARLDEVAVERNAALASTTVSAEEVTGRLTIRQDRGTVTLSQLTPGRAEPLIIGGTLFLRGGIESLIAADGLRGEGDVLIHDTALVQLGGLERVGRLFSLHSNPELVSIDPVGFLGGDIFLVGNAKLPDLNFVAQQELGSLEIFDNPRLVSAEGALANLSRVRGNLVFFNNDALTSLVSPVSEIGGRLSLDGNEALTVARFENVTALASLRIERSRLQAISLPALRTSGPILIIQNLIATQLLLPQLASAASFQASDNSLLATCQLQALCNRLGLTGNGCLLTGNGSHCP